MRMGGRRCRLLLTPIPPLLILPHVPLRTKAWHLGQHYRAYSMRRSLELLHHYFQRSQRSLTSFLAISLANLSPVSTSLICKGMVFSAFESVWGHYRPCSSTVCLPKGRNYYYYSPLVVCPSGGAPPGFRLPGRWLFPGFSVCPGGCCSPVSVC